jgi:hypothetical protein
MTPDTLALALNDLHHTTRTRLEALAVEWLGFGPWDRELAKEYARPWSREPPMWDTLPIGIGAGFDLGVRLVADSFGTHPASVHDYLISGVWDVARYGPQDTPVDKLRAILVDLGRNG